MPGDAVRRLIEGKDSQRGFVCNTHVTCHLQVMGREEVVCDVDSKLLADQRVRTIAVFVIVKPYIALVL